MNDNNETLESIYTENLGFRESLDATTSYNGMCGIICTKEPVLEENLDRKVYDKDATSIAFRPNTATIRVGEEYKPVFAITPDNMNLPALTLISEDEEIVKISPEGVIIGVKAGSTTVTAMSSPGGMNSDPNVSAELTITVE